MSRPDRAKAEGALRSRGYRVGVVSEADIERCGRVLLEAAPPPATVIVFGSYARGTANEGSDLDFLVIEPKVVNRAAESARLRGVLPRLAVPVDVIVLSEQQAQQRARVKGSTVATAFAEGRVVARS
jgi:uncharacterized protein